MAKGTKDKERRTAAASEAPETGGGGAPPDADPILDGGGSVTIGEETFAMRRLGVLDAFNVARILGSGLRMMRAGSYDALSLGAVFVAAMAQHEKQVTTLLADIIGVTYEEFTTDVERFPMDAPVLIIDALAQHQDMARFFSTLTAIQDRMQPTPKAQDKAE